MGSVLDVPGGLPLGSALSGSLPLGMALGGLNRLPLGTARNGDGCSPLGMALRRLAARLGARWLQQFANWLGTLECFGSLTLGSALDGLCSLPIDLALTATASCHLIRRWRPWQLPLGTALNGYGSLPLGSELDRLGSLPLGMTLDGLDGSPFSSGLDC